MSFQNSRRAAAALPVFFFCFLINNVTAEPLTIPKVPKEKVICFALYTVHNNILKLTAQLYPLEEKDSKRVDLEIMYDGAWKKVADAEIVNPGWSAHFRVENWDMTNDYRYRVAACEGVAKYTGLIRKDPVDKEEIVVAAFTGNSNSDRGPRPDIVRNLKKQNPDLLFFSGDQSYDHRRHYAAWLLLGRQFGEIIRDRPTICIPDDHDVGHANLWGEGGVKSHTSAGHDGGYFMPVEYVNMVQRHQTAHLPDPYDPTPIKRGITVYYTNLHVGGIDFAIIEDRKFKTGPHGLVPRQGPRPDHIRKTDFDPSTIDMPEAKLLGGRQLAFLNDWIGRWDGVTMKAVLSQTVLANAAHLHGNKKNRLTADLDSNGWPQSGRNRALKVIRKAFALMICGDQHLATVIHHGINGWEDSGYSFCVPSIVNYYKRWWMPLELPLQRVEGPLEHLGRYTDGFGNKITMYAYANPEPRETDYGKYDKNAAGYGLVRFNKTTRKITIECWPRGVDVTNPEHKQFPGWPVTISQLDNYGRQPIDYLPEIIIEQTPDPFVQTVNHPGPVVQVINEYTGEVVYTLRIKGGRFTPKVFMSGTYTIKVKLGEKTKTVEGVETTGNKKQGEPLKITL